MPIYGNNNEADLNSFKTIGGGYSFSGFNVNSLKSSEYTLVSIATDASSSVTSFGAEIEGCVLSSLEGCKNSPRVDNLMARVTRFNHNVGLDKGMEVHGFLRLRDCYPDRYKNFLKPGGGTALYDATLDSVEAMNAYAKELMDQQDISSNGLIVILTDGRDEAPGSLHTVRQVREAFQKARENEYLESVLTILIGVNTTAALNTYLESFKTEAGFDQYVAAPDTTPKTFARIANFISKSVSSQSQAIKSGSASQPITF